MVTLMLRVKTGSYLRLEAARYYCRKKLSSMANAMAMSSFCEFPLVSASFRKFLQVTASYRKFPRVITSFCEFLEVSASFCEILWLGG